MEMLLQDLRYAFRTLRKSPGFTLVAVLTLTLGIGANTAIFSVVNAVLLRPLPYEEPERLVRLYEATERITGSVSVPNFRDWREQSQSFSRLAAYTFVDANLQGVENPERLSAMAGSANLFRTLGVEPLLGRAFLPGEDERGAPDVVVLSEGLWRRFGADPALLGQTITLNGEANTVIGVMPDEFRFLAGSTGTDLWAPLRFSPDSERGSHWLQVVGRLAPGVTLDQAQSEMDAIARRIAAQVFGQMRFELFDTDRSYI